MYHCRRITPHLLSLFFFNDTATTEIYTLSLHDALPIYHGHPPDLYLLLGRLRHTDVFAERRRQERQAVGDPRRGRSGDRKSTRLNSSHDQISYAVFCLKKKKHILPEFHRRRMKN